MALRDRDESVVEPGDWLEAFAAEEEPVRNPSAAADDSAAPSGAPAPRRFGRFILLGEIGHGGMGIVYRAQQGQPQRIVALKAMQAQQTATPGLLERFRIEAEAISRLDHPNILPVYEAGACDGRPYFTMKLMEGGSLASQLPAFAGEPRKAARLVAEIAQAVHHAHLRGILHRDLKPGNILLDSAGRPCVADFGIAKLLGDDADSATLTGVPLGTPAYMAPEQATEKSATLTVAVDVYSLGTILYELLTQRVPFAAATPLETIRLVTSASPIPLRTVRPDIPRDLETICLKCLEKEPALRYGNAQALAQDLERWLEGRPVLARPVGSAGQVWRWALRNPLPAALASVSGVLLLAVAIGALVSARRLELAHRETREQLRAALLAQAKSSQLTGRLGQRFDALSALRQAAAVRPGLELREEALAALALPDARIERKSDARFESNAAMAFDATLAHYVVEVAPGVVALRNAADDSDVRRYASPAGSPRARGIIFSPDDQRFAVRFADGLVQVFQVSGSEPLFTLTGRPFGQVHIYFVLDFAFTADGRELAVARPEGGVSFHEAASGLETGRMPAEFQPATLAVSPNGEVVAAGALSGNALALFERSSGRILRTLTHPNSVLNCRWRPDGRQLAVACADGPVYLWDPETGEQKHILRGHTEAPIALAYRADGQLLASSGRDYTVRLWNPSDGSPVLTLPALGGGPVLQFSRDGQHLAVDGDTEEVNRLALSIADVRRDIFPGVPGEIFDEVGCLDVSNDGRLVVLSSTRGIRLLDASTGALLANVAEPGLAAGPTGGAARKRLLADGSPAELRSAQFTLKGDAIVYAIAETGVWRRPLAWRIDDTLVIGRAEQIDARQGLLVTQVTSPPTRVALVGTRAPLASIISLANPERPPVDFTLNGVPSTCVLSGDGGFAVTADHVGREPGESDVRLWDARSGAFLRRLNLGRNGDARFSRDGHWLFASGGGLSVLLEWPGLAALPMPEDANLGWFGPGNDLLAVRRERGLALFRVPGRELLGHLPCGWRICARFSPKGDQLFVFSRPHLQVWDLAAVSRELDALGLGWDTQTLHIPSLIKVPHLRPCAGVVWED